MLTTIVGTVLAMSETVQAQQTDLAELSLEDLMHIRVTTVGKRQQRLSQIPAAVYVITQEEIRRSGATNIPDVLRLVPGVEVAQMDDSNWAISIRGFNFRSSNKLLVLIDGRAVYYPSFSNVFWDVQDTFMEDMERIEVIRGPGASLWGANAVNGVINIVTKHASKTEGGLITAGGGSHEKALTAGRYGGRLGDLGHYRAYAKFGLRDHLSGQEGAPLVTGEPDLIRGGFRTDWNLAGANRLTMQGDLYQGSTPQLAYGSPMLHAPIIADNHVSMNGGDALLRWTRGTSGSETTLQAYYDRSRHPDVLLTQFHEAIDFDFQQQLDLERHDLLWGVGFRNTRQASEGNYELSFNPNRRNIQLFSSFLQDDISLIHNRLRLTAGVRLEHNGFTGLEVQPNLRVLWTPSSRQALWISGSRAVRTPNLWDAAISMNLASGVLPNGIPLWQTVSRAQRLRSEELLAYEVGYRTQPARLVSLDLALFYQHYDHLSGVLPGQPYFTLNPTPRLVIPNQLTNLRNGKAYGFEISGSCTPYEIWKLSGSYSRLQQITHSVVPGEVVVAFPSHDGDNPKNQFQLHSYLTLPHRLEADTSVYFVGALSRQGVSSYTRFDTRLGWHPIDRLEFSVGAQNLLNGSHYEFKPFWDYLAHGRVERAFYGRLTWHF